MYVVTIDQALGRGSDSRFPKREKWPCTQSITIFFEARIRVDDQTNWTDCCCSGHDNISGFRGAKAGNPAKRITTPCRLTGRPLDFLVLSEARDGRTLKGMRKTTIFRPRSTSTGSAVDYAHETLKNGTRLKIRHRSNAWLIASNNPKMIIKNKNAHTR